MTDDDKRRFAEQLALRFEDLARWAASHWPDKEHPLLPTHFDAARRALAALGEHPYPGTAENAAEPEPEQGGAQYVDVAPAPWP